MDIVKSMYELECEVKNSRRLSSSENVDTIKRIYRELNNDVMMINQGKVALDIAMDKAGIERKNL